LMSNGTFIVLLSFACAELQNQSFKH